MIDIQKVVDTQAAKNWWVQLTRRYYELQKQLEPLREERGRVDDLRSRLAHVLEAVGVKAEELQQLENGIREQLSAQPQMPPPRVSDMAYEVLASIGKPAHYKEILEGIKERGDMVPGVDPGTNLIAHMLKDRRFAKAPEAGKGYYKLKTWKQEEEH